MSKWGGVACNSVNQQERLHYVNHTYNSLAWSTIEVNWENKYWYL